MNEYIKKFSAHDDYEDYMSSQDKILPNVSYCDDDNEVHYNPYIAPLPVIGMVQVFANPECTEYADGQSNDVWIRLNQPFGYNDSHLWGNSQQPESHLSVYTPTDEFPQDGYGIVLWLGWYSGEEINGPFTAGQIIKCTCPYGGSMVNNPQVIFVPPLTITIWANEECTIKPSGILETVYARIDGEITYPFIEEISQNYNSIDVTYDSIDNIYIMKWYSDWMLDRQQPFTIGDIIPLTNVLGGEDTTGYKTEFAQS